MRTEIEISVVSPVYGAENIVTQLVEEIISSMIGVCSNFEIILIEDHSPDDSWDIIHKLCVKYPFVKGIKLSKNFGQQFAIQAGLDVSLGNYIVTLDCDLQDNPHEIKRLYSKLLEGYDIALASRKIRKDNFFKIVASKFFYAVLSYLTDTDQDHTVANFVMYNRKALNAISQINDKHRYYPMLIQWIGFQKVKVEVEHMERVSGISSYSLKKRVDLALTTIIAFSDKPLRLTIKLGLAYVFLSIIFSIILLILHLFSSIEVKGWVSLVLIIVYFSGTIISVLGIIGIYVGRIFETVKDRPNYVIDKKVNLVDE